MTAIHNLSQLLQQSQCQYQIFDLGRRIQTIEQKDFEQVENGQKAYPYPLQRHAHLAIAYWSLASNTNKDDTTQAQPWIWFLKFPLDERGLLNQTDIGNFLKYVTEAMGAHLHQTLTEEQQQHLANNPYTFKPNDDKMAVFHSMIRASLNLSTSQYYLDAQRYFSGDLGWNNWQNVGLQGITDMCCRLAFSENTISENTASGNAQLIRKALPHLANNPNNHPALYALLGALEHVSLVKGSAEKLAARVLELAEDEIKKDSSDLFLLSAYVRALSGAKESYSDYLIELILSKPELCHAEVLIAIAGRCWANLNTETRAGKFLLRLAQTENQTLFNQVFADCVMIPQLRMIFLPLLNNTPAPELAQALIKLQTQTKSKN